MIHDLSRRLYLKQRQKDKSSDLIFRVFDFPFSTFEPPLWHVSDENSSTHSGICFTTVNQSARPFYMVKPHLPNGSNCPHLWQHLLLSSRLCHGVVVGSSPGSVHWQLPGIHRNQQREQTPSWPAWCSHGALWVQLRATQNKPMAGARARQSSWIVKFPCLSSVCVFSGVCSIICAILDSSKKSHSNAGLSHSNIHREANKKHQANDMDKVPSSHSDVVAGISWTEQIPGLKERPIIAMNNCDLPPDCSMGKSPEIIYNVSTLKRRLHMQRFCCLDCLVESFDREQILGLSFTWTSQPRWLLKATVIPSGLLCYVREHSNIPLFWMRPSRLCWKQAVGNMGQSCGHPKA